MYMRRAFLSKGTGIRCACFFLLLHLPFFADAAAYNFTERQVGGSSYDQVRAMEAIDLDEDGDTDIVSVSDVQNDLTWWDNNGSEVFTERTIDGSIDGIYDVKVIDIDEDGDRDIVFGAANTPKTGWYENNGSETFTQRALNSSYQGTCVDAGDMDGDTDIDIVSCKYGTSIIWWQNNGSESFTEFTVSTGNTTPLDIKVIDLDDDGDSDIVSTWQTGNKVLWYDNNGTGTFTQRTVDSSVTTPYYMDVGDVDDDGDQDVVVGAYSENAVIWYDNNGSETFTERSVGSLTTAEGVAIGDIDGDGDKDIAAAGYDANTIAWFDNNGSETFTSRTINATFEQAGRVQIIDVDGDNDKDVVSAGLTNSNDNVTWWENTGSTAPSVSTLSPADGGYNVSTTANLVITFDQAVQGGTGAVVIKKSSDNSVVETLMMTGGLISGSGTTTITINPSTTLATDTDYYINIGKNAFKGANSPHYAGISTATTWNFTSSDTTAPTVSTLSPTDNATGINQTANLVITFSEIVQGGTGTIIIKKTSDDSTIESIAANNTTYVSGSGTTIITINPASTLTAYVDYYVTIHANAFKDRAANKYAGISAATTWNFTTADLTNPTLSTVSPADNATGVSTTANLVLTFSEAIQIGTGALVIKKSSDNSVVETLMSTGSLMTGSGTTQITANPTTALSLNTSYYITIGKNAFQDAYGRDYAGISTTTTWNFTTTATDTTAPAIVTLSPADEATGVSTTANLVMTFDEAVQGGTGTLVIKAASDGTTIESIAGNNTSYVSGSGTTQITVNPATTLTAGSGYYIIINKNTFQDARGVDYQGFTTTTTWNFTILDSTVPVISSVSATESSTGAVISWVTNETASSRVQYGPSSAYGSFTTLADTSPRVTSHSVTIGSLLSCTQYYYRVISADSSSNTATGSALDFTTTGCTGSADVEEQTDETITTSAGGEVSIDGDDGIVLTIPASATAADAFYQAKKLEKSPVTSTAGTPSGFTQAGNIFNLTALTDASTRVTSFLQPLTVTISYTASDVTSVSESSLWIYRYDGSSWNALSSCSVDTGAKDVSCTTTSFSDFSLFGTTSSTNSTSTSTSGGGGGGGNRRGAQEVIGSLVSKRFGSDSNIAAEKPDIPTSSYKDVLLGDWYASYVLRLTSRDVVSGYNDVHGKKLDMFKPDSSASYAETAKMILGMTNQSPTINASTSADWSLPYMRHMRELSFSLYTASTDPHTPISRSAFLQTALEAFNVPIAKGLQNSFSDLPAAHPFADAILTARSLGIVNGDSTDAKNLTTIRPDAPINRAEVAKILFLMSDRFGMPSPRPVRVIADEPISQASKTPPPIASVSIVSEPFKRIVATPTLNVRSDSRITADVIRKLYKGNAVTVLRIAHNSWVQVRLADGTEGFVWRAHLKK